MMRVAILTDNDFGKVNGVTTTLRRVLKHAPADIEPHVYTLADEPIDAPGYTALAARGVPIPFYAEMRMYAPRIAALRRRLRDDGISAIHMTTPGPVGLAARYLARDLDVPLIGSYHTELGTYTTLLSGSRALGSAMQTYMRWLYGGCRRVLVPSAATRDRLASNGWFSDRLEVWTRGVDGEQFTPARRSAALRAAWGVSDQRLAILYAGRLSREKGLDIFAGLRHLLENHSLPHRIILAGEGPMRAQLGAMLPDAVFTGAIAHARMGEVMASADIFLFPSATDTAGNVVLEAQSAGLPVLVTDLGGPQENMRDRRSGFVCQAGSHRDFCFRLTQLMVDGAKRRGMGAAARQYAAGRGWAPSMQPLFDCYRETLAARRIADRSVALRSRAQARV